MLTTRRIAVVVASLLAACASGLQPPGGLPGAPAASAAVERFLQLAADDDYSGMGWIFGTTDGPILERDPPAEVEQRMFAIASILEHDGFVVGNSSPVPGRLNEAFVYEVIVTLGAQNNRVPFTVVQGPRGRWFVEQVGVEAITSQ